MSIPIKLTELLAIWGAIVSTTAIIWNVIRERRDRARLRLSVIIGKTIPDDTDRHCLAVTIANIGRRPIQVKGWGVKTKKQSYIVAPRNLPQMLKEGEDVTEYTYDLSLLPDLKEILVWDSKGKHWKVSRKDLRRLSKDANRVLSQ